MNSSFKNASDQAYRSIKEMIYQYQLIPGQKITYIQLAEKLGMSKTPIINALHRLEQEEFVVSVRNRGFSIREVGENELEDLFKVREALEILSIEESIKNYDPKLVQDIEKAIIALRDDPSGVFTRRRLALDAAMHLKIAEMARNKSLYTFLKYVFEHIFLRHRVEGISPKRMIETKKEHQEVLDCIKDKDIAKAKAIMKKHIKGAKKAITEGVRLGAKSFNF